VDHPRVTSERARDTGIGALVSLLVLAVNVSVVSSQLGFLHKAKQVKETDQWRYIQMARDPERRDALSREATYCWRVFVPTLARTLMRAGLGENLSFWLITNVSLFGFLLVSWLYLRDLGFELPYRVAGLLLLGFTQAAVRWYEYQYWMTDPPSLFPDRPRTAADPARAARVAAPCQHRRGPGPGELRRGLPLLLPASAASGRLRARGDAADAGDRTRAAPDPGRAALADRAGPPRQLRGRSARHHGAAAALPGRAALHVHARRLRRSGAAATPVPEAHPRPGAAAPGAGFPGGVFLRPLPARQQHRA